MSESFEDVCASYGDFTWIGRDEVKKIIARLQMAHEHEMEQHMREQYHCGYIAGQKSMDAEHYAVALRLRQLPLDGGSHENLSSIARAIWHGDFGWTKGACSALRDKIIELLGGVHDEPVSVGASGGAGCADCDCGAGEPWRVSCDGLGNERHEAVCKLRCIRDCLIDNSISNSLTIADAIGARLNVGERVHESICDRLIYLLGGDEPYSNITRTSLEPDGGDAVCKRAETDKNGEICETEPRIEKLKRQRDGYKKAMCAAQDLLEKRTCERDELQSKLDAIREALDGQQRHVD